FFQAEDGIRDRNVTGVQTCALPILNTVRLLLLMFIALLSTGCELWYNSDKQKGDLRILIAASPKAELSEAYLSITKIKVQHQAEIGRASCRGRAWDWELNGRDVDTE